MEITSRDNPTFKELLKLTDKKWRHRLGLCIIEGEKVIKDNSNRIVKTFVRPRVRGQYCDVYVLDDKLFNMVSSLESDTGILAIARTPAPKKEVTMPFLVLDGIQDAGNMGTLLRSAAAFGYNTVFCLDCVDVWSPKVLRASSGMSFTLNLIECSPKEFVKPEGSVLIGADMNGGDVSGITQKNLGIVLGNEGRGIRECIKSRIDGYVTIPMHEGIDSLNVGVAGAILMYEFRGMGGSVAQEAPEEKAEQIDETI